jgi:beta-N-acetylhexosaminidase
MLAHIEFPNIDADFPASLSPKIIRRFLRDQLGFDRHLVMTDDLDMGAITKRYGRGEDVKLAIRAGNDLAMICHRNDTAEAAARAIGELPLGMRHEAQDRVERFRRRVLRPPAAWSAPKWQNTCAKIAQLAAEFDPAEETVSNSPVADY